MTFRYTMKNPVVSIDNCSWFQKSYDEIEDALRDVDEVDRDYEEKFNVKLIYGKPKEDGAVKPIVAVEFSSEEEATLFLLRWT